MPFEKPTVDQLTHRFGGRYPKGDQPLFNSQVRHAIKQAAVECVRVTPCSPEQSRALNALDEAMYLFLAAIERGE